MTGDGAAGDLPGDDFAVPPDCDLGEWLQATGADADIAVCTRVRFARNVKGFRFATCMPAEEATELTRYVRGQLTRTGLAEELQIRDVDELTELERRGLLERHLISREFATAERARAVAVNDTGSVSVMINEEDHIRIQVFRSGNSIDDAYRRAEALDEAIMERIPMAFSDEFGFLTACPTNTGTGLRVSVMLHLPGLVWADEIGKATTAAQKTNMAVRGSTAKAAAPPATSTRSATRSRSGVPSSRSPATSAPRCAVWSPGSARSARRCSRGSRAAARSTASTAR